MVPQLLVNALVLCSTYALLTLGFVTIFGATRIFHFAHGSVYAVSAYLFLFALKTAHLPFIVAALLSIAGAVIVGILIDVLAYEPLIKRNSSRFAIFITSLGVFTIFDSLVALPFGRSPQVLPSVFPSTPVQIGTAFITPAQLVIVGVSSILLAAVPIFFSRTRLGVAIRALASDPVLAQVIGVNVKQTRIAVFGFGSGLASVAATLATLDTGVVDTTINLNATLVATISVIFGGIGSMAGATLGAIFLGAFRIFASGFAPSAFIDPVQFILVVLVVMFRPRGLLGKKLSRLGR